MKFALDDSNLELYLNGNNIHIMRKRFLNLLSNRCSRFILNKKSNDISFTINCCFYKH